MFIISFHRTIHNETVYFISCDKQFSFEITIQGLQYVLHSKRSIHILITILIVKD